MLGPNAPSVTLDVKTISDPGTERNETFLCVLKLLTDEDGNSNDDQRNPVFIHHFGSRAVITIQDQDDGNN